MKMWFSKKMILLYGVSLLLNLFILTWLFHLSSADLTIPFNYTEDGVGIAELVKGMIENGWYLTNGNIGAPFEQNIFDYPLPETMNFLIMKIISFFTGDYAIVLNLYYLLTYPLVTIASVFVLRKFNISYISSVICSLLFTFLPYHYMRGEAHLFLSSYYMVPIIILVMLKLFEEEPFNVTSIHNAWRSRNLYLAILVCILVSCGDIYYAFFSCILLVVSGISSSINKRKWINFNVSILLTLTIGLGVLVNMLPYLVHQINNGKNLDVAQRDTSHSEILGLKIIQLILPVDSHRINLLSRLKNKYNSTAPLLNENTFSTLGTIATVGFMLLLFWAVIIKYRSKHDSFSNLVGNLSQLNISIVLVATIGGFGTLFSLIVSPEIRGYNRTSIFIGYFALFAVALLMDKFVISRFKNKKVVILIAMIVLFGGLLDQTNNHIKPNYTAIKSEYNNNDSFIKQIESIVPPKSMIFQLPYVSYPENPPVESMGGYDQFKPYLSSKTLIWSFGAMRGRESDLWQRDILKKPIIDMVETLALADFKGIYVDRNGYKDKGVEMEKELTNIFKNGPIISENGRLLFYDISDYAEKLKVRLLDKNVNEDLLRNSLTTLWTQGFYGEESNGNKIWHWSSSNGTISLINQTAITINATIEFDVYSGFKEFSDFSIKSKLFNRDIKINSNGTHFSTELKISKGNTAINFKSDAKQILAPNDPRNLSFRIENLKIIFKEIKS